MSSAFKMLKVVGESSIGFEDAVKVALNSVGQKKGLTWAQISDIRANLNDQGGIDRWQLTVDVAIKTDA